MFREKTRWTPGLSFNKTVGSKYDASGLMTARTKVFIEPPPVIACGD
jgi:hypothetical protein